MQRPGAAALPRIAGRLRQAAIPRRKRLRRRQFWVVQILVAAASVVTYASDLLGGDNLLAGGMHDIPVMLYLLPVLYATVVFGLEGTVLTGVFVMVLMAPHALLADREEYEWLGDVGTLVVIMAACLVLAGPVERERAHRTRAEAASRRLAVLHELSRALAPARSTPDLLRRLADQLRARLDLDAAWAASHFPGDAESEIALSEATDGEIGHAAVRRDAAYAREIQRPHRPGDGWLVVPILADRVLGAVAGQRRSGGLTEEEEDVLLTVAQQAAVILEGLRLEQEHHRRLASYARRVTAAQEEEQRRIARDLHDGVVQDLSGLCRGLDLLRAELDTAQGDPQATAVGLRTVATGALQDIRRIMRDLRPTILDDLGLIAAIQWLCTELADRTALPVTFQSRGEPVGLPAERELMLFRVAQEALRNTEKHANAKRVDVSLIADDEGTYLTVQDDGAGFLPPADVNDLARQGRYGLQGMQERAALSGGRLQLESVPGLGTTVALTIPHAAAITDAGPAPADDTAAPASTRA